MSTYEPAGSLMPLGLGGGQEVELRQKREEGALAQRLCLAVRRQAPAVAPQGGLVGAQAREPVDERAVPSALGGRLPLEAPEKRVVPGSWEDTRHPFLAESSSADS